METDEILAYALRAAALIAAASLLDEECNPHECVAIADQYFMPYLARGLVDDPE